MSSSSSSSVYTEDFSDEEESCSYPDADSPTLQYWRRVTGNDLFRILNILKYDDGAIKRFLQYFLKNIPPAWGFVSSKNSTDPGQLASSLNLDNSPVEIGLTYTAERPNPIERPPIRLITEVDHLTAKRSLDEYCRRNILGCIRYEMDWADSLYRSIMKDGGSPYFGDVRVGFNIRPALRRSTYNLIPPGPGPIPADARAYFLASRKAQHQGITHWALIRQSILDLPGIDGYKYLVDQGRAEPIPNFYPSFVPRLFPGLPLNQDPWLRLHTSVTFCCQEGGMGRSDDWTLRAYYNPLYYKCARP